MTTSPGCGRGSSARCAFGPVFVGLPDCPDLSLVRIYAPHQIRVNAVCPGEIHPPMLEPGVKRSGRAIADLDRVAPYGRIGKPEDVAAPSRLPGE